MLSTFYELSCVEADSLSSAWPQSPDTHASSCTAESLTGREFHPISGIDYSNQLRTTHRVKHLTVTTKPIQRVFVTQVE